MEVSKTVGRKKRKIVGDTDYTIGFGKGMDLFGKTPPTELHLVAIEAKKDWGEGDLWQCVGNCYSLKDAGKTKCSIWGVLSNAVIWQFCSLTSKDYFGDPMRFHCHCVRTRKLKF
jgi:hypothetical protein